MWKELVDGVDFDSTEWVTMPSGRKGRMISCRIYED